MKKSVLKRKSIQLVLPLFLGAILLSLGSLSFMDSFKMPFAYVFEPVAFSARGIEKSIAGWGNALFGASSYIKEYEELKKEVIQLSAGKEQILDYEEYNSLKESSSVFIPEGKYALAQVLGITEKGDLYINVGTKDSVKEGDPVFVEKVFVGVIDSVERSSALVRLPTNRVSTYEVVILPSDVEDISSLDGYIKSRAVISGSLDGIKIENIGSNADVSDGDIVVLRDERVGQLFIVGRIVSLSKNPAATSRSGFVSPVFDYSNLLTVFVRVE